MKQILRSPHSPIDRLLVFSLQHGTLIVALAIALVAVGLVAAWQLPGATVGAEPPQSARLVVSYPGHSAEEVETAIATPIEHALQDLPQIKITAEARPDWAVITLSYPSAVEEDRLREQVQGRLDKLALPPGVYSAMVRVPAEQ